MNCLAGVDEAGLGPILGPLVVAGVAMRGPEGLDPWAALRGHVSRRKHVDNKVRVADSKKVHQGPHGKERLESTALSFWTAFAGDVPTDVRGFLAGLGIDLAPLSRCPWYGELAMPLPRFADRGFVELKGALIGRHLDKQRIDLLEIAVRPVDVEEWNRWIEDTDNKSRAHFQAYSEVLGRMLARASGKGHVVADRCGGRMHYLNDLRRLCPGADVAVVQEEPAASSYRIVRGGDELAVTFAEQGEDRAFPTALASCFAKYVRELLVDALNHWFCARVPGLSPTAGYYSDGHRFLRDLEPHFATLQIDRGHLVRVR